MMLELYHSAYSTCSKTVRLTLAEKGLAKDADQRTLRKGFYGKMNDGAGFSDKDNADASQHLQLTAGRLQAALSSASLMLGEKLSLVDLTLAPLIDRMLDLKLTEYFDGDELVLDWMERLQDRPAFERAVCKCARLSDRTEFQYARLRKWVAKVFEL